MRKHEGTKEGDVGKVGPLRPTLAPREQRRIGRRDRVPQLLDIVDGHVERLRKRLFREPRRHADAHPAERELEERVATDGVEPVEQSRDAGGSGAAGRSSGRATCGEREGTYGWNAGVDVRLKKKNKTRMRSHT